MNCKICGKNLGLGTRYVLLEETQMCLWRAPDVMPEVNIGEAVVLGYYCCEQHAMEAVSSYLTLAGGEATWSNILPIDNCGICKESFNTNIWHKVLTLSKEHGHDNKPEIINNKYVARFCQKCNPVV